MLFSVNFSVFELQIYRGFNFSENKETYISPMKNEIRQILMISIATVCEIYEAFIRAFYSITNIVLFNSVTVFNCVTRFSKLSLCESPV